MNIEPTKEQHELLLTTSGIGGAIFGILGDVIVETEADYKKLGQEADSLEKHLLGYACTMCKRNYSKERRSLLMRNIRRVSNQSWMSSKTSS
ncbi:MAG: hypothetical protein WCL23_05260 [Candidatus Moraniibacteriota bacterium]